MGRAWAVLSIAALAMMLGCADQPTGVHVHAHMPGEAYDELRFSVVLVPTPESMRPARTIVDPATTGRYQGSFGGTDQDVIIYLGDDVAAQMINCGATALAGGVMIASGAAEVTVESQRILDVDVFLLPPVMSADTGTASSSGDMPASP
ncbi:MAG TPA: hypothetical protein VMU50_14845 [Polyangia bacterium]|nr:hypothetical protein [Polyangia bacterium]